MLLESQPWKMDLKRRMQLLLKYNTPENFDQKPDATYTAIEKCIFYSAFIIRKLIDCGGKLSDEADNYTFEVKSINPLKPINRLSRCLEEDSHNWKKQTSVAIKGKDICNSLIHSYLFFVEFDEIGIIVNFLVSSDYDRNKCLYKVSLSDWVTYMNYIVTDNIVSLSSHFDSKSGDYIYSRKERGK